MQGKRLGGYILGHRLGSGGMGPIYAATPEEFRGLDDTNGMLRAYA